MEKFPIIIIIKDVAKGGHYFKNSEKIVKSLKKLFKTRKESDRVKKILEGSNNVHSLKKKILFHREKL